MSFFLSANESEFALKALKQGLRIDGRNLVDSRQITAKFAKNPGEVEFSLGQTVILSKVNCEIVTPREERPSEGFLKFKVDLSVLNEDKQNRIFSPKEYSNEISKLLERVFKGSKALDTESLCIITGKAVWSLSINVTLMNNGGNLIDACYLASLLGLLNFRKPFIKIENESEIKVFSAKEKSPLPLSITHIPLSFTYGFFSEANQVISDPTDMEEEIMEGRITIVMNIYRDICLIHKPGGAPLDPFILEQLIAATEIKVNELTVLVRDFIQHSESYSVYGGEQEKKIRFDWGSKQAETIIQGELKEGIEIEEIKQTLQGKN